jgi:two-component system, chemotaxis family, chemotaxis protein CheY
MKILICDDSGFARKQMIRALPKSMDAEISQAANGEEALEIIKQGKAEITFLDLTMPVMDGFTALEHIQKEDLPTFVIVVSGDIQPESEARVKKLGAMEFVKKPVSTEKIEEVMKMFGFAGE